MARKPAKPGSPQPTASASPLFDELRALLKLLETPPAAVPDNEKRPGRPVKRRADTAPVILHLYKSQLSWLDHYAEAIAAMRPGNARLSRVEIVRGLLLGLAVYALECDMDFPLDLPVTSEGDFQRAIAEALRRSQCPPKA